MKIAVLTPPETYPVDLDAAIEFARLDGDDTATIDILLGAATDLVEKYLGRALVNRTYTLTLTDWPANKNNSEWWDGTRVGKLSELLGGGGVELPYPPAVSISEIRTLDADGDATVMSSVDYYLQKDSEAPQVIPVSSWPTPGRDYDGIEIDYIAGYGEAGDVNPAIKSAILITFAELYEKRGGDGAMPQVAKQILSSFRVLKI